MNGGVWLETSLWAKTSRTWLAFTIYTSRIHVVIHMESGRLQVPNNNADHEVLKGDAVRDSGGQWRA